MNLCFQSIHQHIYFGHNEFDKIPLTEARRLEIQNVNDGEEEITASIFCKVEQEYSPDLLEHHVKAINADFSEFLREEDPNSTFASSKVMMEFVESHGEGGGEVISNVFN